MLPYKHVSLDVLTPCPAPGSQGSGLTSNDGLSKQHWWNSLRGFLLHWMHRAAPEEPKSTGKPVRCIHFGPSKTTLVPPELLSAGGVGLEPVLVGTLGGEPAWGTPSARADSLGFEESCVEVASRPLWGPHGARALCRERHVWTRTHSDGSARLVGALPLAVSCNSQTRVTFRHGVSCHR